MGAYVEQKNSGLNLLPDGMTGGQTHEQQKDAFTYSSPELSDGLPSLPKIGQELGIYFNAAQRLETALAQERTQLRKWSEEYRNLHDKFSRLSVVEENNRRDYRMKEDRLRTELAISQQNERQYREKLEELSRQIGKAWEGKKEAESEVERLSGNFASVKNELDRYKASWQQVQAIDQKAKQVIQGSGDTRKRLEELSVILSNEKRRNENLEEAVKKERREKQLALTHLHSAEERLEHMTRLLEKIRSGSEQNMRESGLNLQF